MEKALRIKPSGWFIEIGIPVIILTIIAGAIWLVFGEINLRSILLVVFLVVTLLHTVFFMRLHNPFHLIPIGFYSFAAFTFYSISLYFKYVTGTIAAMAGIFFILFMWVLVKRKIKWRYREVLELAARSVRSASDGFTARPYLAGRISFDPVVMADFAKFLLKYAIAFPITDNQKLVFVIPDNMLIYLLGLKKAYQDVTHLIIHPDGKFLVKISEKDYRKYLQELTFDQLCAALGNLFIDFFKDFQDGKGRKIIKRMDELQFIV